jgi:CubicO group peptidase (beta-lactamase class C family)
MDPEDLGFDTAKLDQMSQAIIDQNIAIDSIQIARFGYLCYDKYFEYYNYSNIHNTFSVTKSVINALIGIANSTGMITNLDEPVVEIFSNRTIQNLDTRKEAMTIRHLLEMRSGLEVNDLSAAYFIGSISYNDFAFRTDTTTMLSEKWIDSLNPENDYTRLMNSSDWIQFALDKPMDAEPGTKFAYSDCITHLLSAIIREKTGMNTETFAKQYLFDPLNITEYLWWEDPSGLSFGADGLWLTPKDILKIGYLYLNEGKWNEIQIVPTDWVVDSTQTYTVYNPTYGYGYQWWTNIPNDYYFADGLGGQQIFVKSDLDLVVVFTAWDLRSIEIYSLFDSFIVDSIDSNVIVPYPTTTIPSSTSSTITDDLTTTTNTDQTSASSIFLGTVVLLIITQIKRRKMRYK